MKRTSASERFKFITAFELTVPENYDHTTYLDNFRKTHEKEFEGRFWSFEANLSDKNFSGVTIKFVPGQKFVVKMFEIQTKNPKSSHFGATSKECLAFLGQQNAILVGAQGLAMVYEQKKDELPKGRGIVGEVFISYDKKKALWNTRLSPYSKRLDAMVPHLVKFETGFKLCLNCFINGNNGGDYLLCFCKH